LNYHIKYREEVEKIDHSQSIEREDVLYKHALSFVLEVKMVSISKIQRAFRVGYNQSSKVIDRMEVEGYVSSAKPDGSRRLLSPFNKSE
jgi:S-DNA-T family DNA segregation ATPase FtsK/SpoIIIE